MVPHFFVHTEDVSLPMCRPRGRLCICLRPMFIVNLRDYCNNMPIYCTYCTGSPFSRPKPGIHDDVTTLLAVN